MDSLPGSERGAWDRRTAPRIQTILPAVYRPVTRERLHAGPEGAEPPLPARARNVSAVGVLLLVTERLDPHTVVSLALRLPENGEPVQSLAEVRHVQPNPAAAPYPFAVGLEFLSISTLDAQRVYRFVGRGLR